jgi:hypothetical protein
MPGRGWDDRRVDPDVPWWGVVSAAAAPVALIGGWTWAAARQPGGFDPVAGTISALAGRGATDRWLMTSALLALGACHVTTAAALRPGAAGGRVLLAVGGVATVGVAGFPLPADGGSVPHGVAAAVAFGALAGWPALIGRRGVLRPYGLPPVACGAAAGVLLGLVGWFAAELRGGAEVGLAERAAAGAQALCPLLVVLAVRSRRARSGRSRQRPGRVARAARRRSR